MIEVKKHVGITILFLSFFWGGVASASTWLPGKTVDSAGSESIVGSGGPIIEYFIPLKDGNYGKTYGVDSSTCGNPWSGYYTGVSGTCSDYGPGDSTQYDKATGLAMNIWYDTDGAEFSSATMKFAFDDLDLIGDNDPYGFYESISLSYYSYDHIDDDFDINPIGGTIKTAGGGPNLPSIYMPNLILWSLGVTDLLALNTSSQEKGGFWIQLGFGAKYLDRYGNPRNGKNTPEYLATALHVSPVPLPSAVWLFGTALLGFIGISRRTKV